ncbi:MAG: glycogen/starch synthase, partial [Actinobacteria bacterium]|nr:glycogen/starch synthase [Actinomycetota bacterium]
GWAGPATVRRGTLGGVEVSLVAVPGMARPHPYLDADGQGWPDNDQRVLAFSMAVAAWVTHTSPDVIHRNDWHTGATLGFLDDPPPSVLTIHNLAYQGVTSGDWLERFIRRSDAYDREGDTNPLAGAITLADRVITVSPTFAAESLQPETGFGVSELLEARGETFSGILNGIDTGFWNPATDPHLDQHYDIESFDGKREVGRSLVAELGWEPSGEPLIGMVTRLTDQKGVDLALEATSILGDVGARMVLLGSGERSLAGAARLVADQIGDRFTFRDGYDEGLAHRIFGGSDLYLMPSRFEPSGLTQMQAMRYGSIPVVTDVGGLHDTVTDADRFPTEGTGFVADEVSGPAIRDALERAVSGWRTPSRRTEIIRRGMSRDWSWDAPADLYNDVYSEIMSVR